MPRNGSDGTYSPADTVAPSTLADANEVQTIFDDIVAALTGSVAKDGQTPLTGQLKGLVSGNPVYAFDGDSNTGYGSDTADESFIKAGGTKIAKFTSAGLEVLSGNLIVTGGELLVNGVRPVETGFIFDYIGAAAPTGYVLGTGGSIGDGTSGATARANADTFALYQLIYNAANQASGEGQVQDSAGSNVARGASATADFAAHKRILLPDYQDRVSRGKSGSTALGDTAGADTVTIAKVNIPNYALTVTESPHSHTSPVSANLNPASASPNGAIGNGGTLSTSSALTGITVNSGGSGTALDVKPKSIVKTKIIKL